MPSNDQPAAYSSKLGAEPGGTRHSPGVLGPDHPAAKEWREPKGWLTKAGIAALVEKALAPVKEALLHD